MKYELVSAGIILNATSANEHIPKIERQIRVTKERVCATREHITIQRDPTNYAHQSHLYLSTLWIDAFPPKESTSLPVSPHDILSGIQFDFNKHCKLQFGIYVWGHQEPSPTYTQSANTVGAICLGLAGHILLGSYKFLNKKEAEPKEFSPRHFRNTFEPINGKDLTE